MYDPESAIGIDIILKNQSSSEATGEIELSIKHLNQQVGKVITRDYALHPHAEETIRIDWQAPSNDFLGYLIEVNLKDVHNHYIDHGVVAVDVSSSWVKFPRYGYVWDFTKDVNVSERIDKLKDYHINALEYYDWKYRHHKPVPDHL